MAFSSRDLPFHEGTYQPVKESTNWPRNLPTNQPTNRPRNLPTGQGTYQPAKEPTNQSNNLPTDQGTFQTVKEPINRSRNLPTGQGTHRPSCSVPISRPATTQQARELARTRRAMTYSLPKHWPISQRTHQQANILPSFCQGTYNWPRTPTNNPAT